MVAIADLAFQCRNYGQYEYFWYLNGLRKIWKNLLKVGLKMLCVCFIFCLIKRTSTAESEEMRTGSGCPSRNLRKFCNKTLFRSSASEVFLGKSVLKICSKFTGEQSNFIEITLQHGCSLVSLLHIFRPPFRKNTSEEVLLHLPFGVLKGSCSPNVQTFFQIKCSLNKEFTQG